MSRRWQQKGLRTTITIAAVGALAFATNQALHADEGCPDSVCIIKFGRNYTRGDGATCSYIFCNKEGSTIYCNYACANGGTVAEESEVQTVEEGGDDGGSPPPCGGQPCN